MSIPVSALHVACFTLLIVAQTSVEAGGFKGGNGGHFGGGKHHFGGHNGHHFKQGHHFKHGHGFHKGHSFHKGHNFHHGHGHHGFHHGPFFTPPIVSPPVVQPIVVAPPQPTVINQPIIQNPPAPPQVKVVLPSPDAPQHVGNFEGQMDGGVTVQLALLSDNTFQWIATDPSGISQQFTGTYSYERAKLKLRSRETKKTFAGEVVNLTENGFQFEPYKRGSSAISFVRV